MNVFRRIAHIALKESLELWRHAGIVAFVLAIPIVEIIVLGYATSGSVENLPTAIIDAEVMIGSLGPIHFITIGEATNLDMHLPLARN